LKYEYKASFDKTFKKLGRERQQGVKKAVSALIDFFESGEKASDLGLKQLRGDFWEIRSGIRDRIIFAFNDNVVRFVIIGNHDEIRKFLKNLLRMALFAFQYIARLFRSLTPDLLLPARFDSRLSISEK